MSDRASCATTSAQRTQVLIVGGGIIGAACADALARRGLTVTVIDKRRPGFGCSYGNAGWITPCFALPLPMPGMLLKSLGWMLDPDGPLYVKPRPSWLLVRWMLRFARSLNVNLMQQSVAALTGIARYSLEAYAQLDREQPGSFGFAQKGMLMVAQSSAGRDDAVRELELVAPHGISGRALDADQVRQLEPAVTGPIAGGVFFPDEAHCEPLAAVQALVRRAEQHGAVFMPETELFDFELRGGRIQRVYTTRGPIVADQVVLATGAWSAAVGAKLKLRLPMLSGKGYAVIVPPLEPSPSIPVMLLEKKIAVTPRADSVRLAGTLELVGLDESITARRVDALVRGTRQYLNVPQQPKIIEVWRGLRPCTPDGVPIIGRAPRIDNLFIAAGHQMLGLLSAPGTGTLIADLIANAAPSFDPHPFRADRF